MTQLEMFRLRGTQVTDAGMWPQSNDDLKRQRGRRSVAGDDTFRQTADVCRTANCELRAVCGTVFVFRKRRGAAIMVLAYDGQSARRPRVPGRRFDAIGK